MRCEEARPLISAGLDGELQDHRVAELCEHVAACVLCQTERDVLTGTVRLLRALPEAEPPAALRRRIGVALLEEERRAQRRHLGWAWRARPQGAGWAWGAAVGAIVATVALVMTRGGAPRPQIANVPTPVSPPTPKMAAALPAPPDVRPATGRKPVSAAPKQPERPAPKVDHSSLTARLPAPQAPSAAARREASLPGRPAVTPRPRPVDHGRAQSRQHPGVRPRSSTAASSLLVRGASPREDKVTPRSVSSDRDSPRVVRMDPPSSATPPTPVLPDPEDSSDTSGMTQMASSPMTSTPVETKDDLAELRRRLTDRPLQVPELGQLKPAGSRGAGRDGWIRF